MIFYEIFNNVLSTNLQEYKDLSPREILTRLDEEQVESTNKVAHTEAGKKAVRDLFSGLNGYVAPDEKKLSKQRERREAIIESTVGYMNKTLDRLNRRLEHYGGNPRLFGQTAPNYLNDQDFQKWVDAGEDIGLAQVTKNFLHLIRRVDELFPENKLDPDILAANAGELQGLYSITANSTDTAQFNALEAYLYSTGLSRADVAVFLTQVLEKADLVSRAYEKMKVMANPLYDEIDLIQIFENEELSKQLDKNVENKAGVVVEGEIDSLDQEGHVSGYLQNDMLSYTFAIKRFASRYRAVSDGDFIQSYMNLDGSSDREPVMTRLQFAKTAEGRVLMLNAFGGTKITDVTETYHTMQGDGAREMKALNQLIDSLDRGNMAFRSKDSEYGVMRKAAKDLKALYKELEQEQERIDRDPKLSPEQKTQKKTSVVLSKMETILNQKKVMVKATKAYLKYKTDGVTDMGQLNLSSNAKKRVQAAIDSLDYLRDFGSQLVSNRKISHYHREFNLDAVENEVAKYERKQKEEQANVGKQLVKGAELIHKAAMEAKETLKSLMGDNAPDVKRIYTALSAIVLDVIVQNGQKNKDLDNPTNGAILLVAQKADDPEIVERVSDKYLEHRDLKNHVMNHAMQLQKDPKHAEAGAFVEDLLNKGGETFISTVFKTKIANESKNGQKNKVKNPNGNQPANQKPAEAGGKSL